ncbi:MAG: DUF3276 family protein [Acidobacteria bacterium]|nr:DUF3276 family protein [Acidobacteriota bacterium]
MMADIERKEIFTEKVIAGSRTCFFDAKQSKDGTRYLVISESRRKGSSHEHNRVMIFEENLQEFAQGFNKVLQFLGIKSKPYNVDVVRQKYPKAYEKWTPEEDEQLKMSFREGVSVSDMAIFFQRQPSAVRSRLSKLELSPQEKESA